MDVVRFVFMAMAALAVVLVAPDSARAQGSPTGTLAGTISDSSGGVLPGVTVIATEHADRSDAADHQRRRG